MPTDPSPYLKQWGLTLDGEMQQGWVGSVFPVSRKTRSKGRQKGVIVQKLVLKLAGDNDPQFDNHVTAMKMMAGTNMVRVVENQPGAVLMERLQPAEPLTTIGSAGATVVAAGTIMNMLRTPVSPGHGFRTVEDLLGEFPLNDCPLPADMLRQARDKMAELGATVPEQVLLHGDLHHGNIVRHQNTWVAIDPDPIVADRAYEAAAFLRNPYGTFAVIPNLERFMGQRISRIAELLQCDPRRVVDWAFCRTAMSVANNWERTGTSHEPWVAATRAFAAIAQNLDQSRGPVL